MKKKPYLSPISETCHQYISNIPDYRWSDPCEINFELSISTKIKDEKVQAGTHLVILDDRPCDATNAERLSDPTILNYYRQFLIQGFDDLCFPLKSFTSPDREVHWLNCRRVLINKSRRIIWFRAKGIETKNVRSFVKKGVQWTI